VERVACERARLLAMEADETDVENAGRIAAFAPDESLHDGAACGASDGYFDDDNVPGWDAWICYVMSQSTAHVVDWPVSHSSYLLSWVPTWLIPLVEEAIDANPNSVLCGPARSTALSSLPYVAHTCCPKSVNGTWLDFSTSVAQADAVDGVASGFSHQGSTTGSCIVACHLL
jgi:hypothetical protein